MSEISTNGKTLDFDANYQTGLESISLLKWPRQAKPNHVAWKLWKRAIRKLCRPDGQTLRTSLSNNWFPTMDSQQTWRYLYDPPTTLLHDTQEGSTYQLSTSTQRHHIFTPTTPQTASPTSLPVKPHPKGLTLHLDYLPMPAPDSILTRDPPQTPTHSMLVSDGSVRHSQGTFGWVKSNGTEVTEKDKGWVPGNNATTSYRAEAQGITDGLFSGPVPPNLQAYLDNESVVHQLNRDWPLNPLQPEWELLEPTRQLVK